MARLGSFVSIGQFRLDTTRERWETADSVGGHIGYRNILDPFENPYVIGIMSETLDALDSARKAESLKRRDRRAGRCVCCHGSGRLAS
jgi:hypothetical protein